MSDDPHIERFEKSVESSFKSIDELDDAISALIGSKDPASHEAEELAIVIADIKRLSDAVKPLMAKAERALGLILSNGDMVSVPDRGVVVEKRKPYKRSDWQHVKLRPLVIEGVLDSHRDPVTGTIDTPLSVVMADLLDTAGIGYWRVGKLKQYGIEANKYCTKTESDPKFFVSGSAYSLAKSKEQEEDDDDFV